MFKLTKQKAYYDIIKLHIQTWLGHNDLKLLEGWDNIIVVIRGAWSCHTLTVFMATINSINKFKINTIKA